MRRSNRAVTITKVCCTCAAGLALWSFAQPALAYILPADPILASVAKRRESLAFKNLVVLGVLERPGSDKQRDEVKEILVPGVGHRVEIQGADGNKTIVLTLGQRRYTFRQGEKAGAPTTIRPSLLLSFLSSTSNTTDLQRFVAQYRIDDDVVTLGRLGRSIAYVLGADPWTLDRPQLWIDKNLRLPIRFIELDPETKERRDIRLLGFGSAVTGEWWPRVIETYRSDALVQTVTYHAIKIDETIDPALMRPPT